MWDGEGAVEFAGFTYRRQSGHQITEPAASEKCVTCHVFMTPFVSDEEPAATGHTFNPRLEACGQAGCHADEMTILFDTLFFNDVGPDAFSPFDHEGRQTYTDSLMTVLRDILENVSSADSLTQTFADAKFNLEFVDNSGSEGVHNTLYAEDVLTSNIEVARTTFTGVETLPGDVPRVFSLDQNYPNPFGPSTTIPFAVPRASRVKLIVYDLLGRQVSELVDREMAPGLYKASFDADHLASGTYFYTLKAENVSLSKKMMLVK